MAQPNKRSTGAKILQVIRINGEDFKGDDVKAINPSLEASQDFFVSLNINYYL